MIIPSEQTQTQCVVVIPEHYNPAAVELAMSEIDPELLTTLLRLCTLENMPIVHRVTPFSEETIRLWQLNGEFSDNPRVISLQEMPSDEVVQAHLRVATSAESQAFFEVSGNLLGFQ